MIDLRRGRTGPLPRPVLVGAALALALVAASCNGSGSSSDDAAGPSGAGTTGTTVPPVEYPDARWSTVDPGAAGFDPATLATVPTELDGTETDCVVVVKDGKVAYQHTWNGFDADADRVVWSVSKSITGLLVGIAADEGKLRIDQPAADFVTEWKGTPAEAVTIRNLLSMDSGRHWDYRTDFVVMPLETDDQTAFAIGLEQQFPPGTRWVYNNGAVQVLEAVLSRATGTPVVDYARDKLFAPLGIEATWLLDKAGHPWTYGGASMSCLELARIGHLMLNDGRWKDRQVVPEAWVHESVKPSQALRGNYGYLWWLNLPKGPPAEGQPADVQAGDVAPGVAPNAYFARGLLGQYLTVIPDDDTIVVRTGRQPPQPGRFKDEDEVLNHLLAIVTRAEQANPD